MDFEEPVGRGGTRRPPLPCGPAGGVHAADELFKERLAKKNLKRFAAALLPPWHGRSSNGILLQDRDSGTARCERDRLYNRVVTPHKACW